MGLMKRFYPDKVNPAVYDKENGLDNYCRGLRIQSKINDKILVYVADSKDFNYGFAVDESKWNKVKDFTPEQIQNLKMFSIRKRDWELLDLSEHLLIQG